MSVAGTPAGEPEAGLAPGRALTETAPAPLRSGALRGVLVDLLLGLRLALTLRAPLGAFRFGPGYLLALLGLDAALLVGIDFLLAEEPREFYPPSLALEGSRILLVVLLLYATVRTAAPPGRRARGDGGLERLVTLLAAAAPVPLATARIAVVSAVNAESYEGVDTGWTLAWVVWCALLASRGLLLCVATERRRHRFTALVLAGGFGFVVSVIPAWPVWVHYIEDDAAASVETPASPIDVERVYYAQPELLDEALARLAPQRPGVVDLYFLGFASYADEAVFMREAQHFQRYLDERFDTAGRSLLLVNHPDVIEALPLASSHNLARALRRIGRIIDPAEDVVFLYLTSHGTQAELSVQFTPLGLSDLSADALARMLADSGIVHRVVGISACYSGSFIDALAGPETLVMTAARADRTSFGCSNEREFTYFGEALRGALFERPSFIDAFDLARERVTAREREEGKDPSYPQIRVGRRVEPVLRALEERLAAG